MNPRQDLNTLKHDYQIYFNYVCFVADSILLDRLFTSCVYYYVNCYNTIAFITSLYSLKKYCCVLELRINLIKLKLKHVFEV